MADRDRDNDGKIQDPDAQNWDVLKKRVENEEEESDDDDDDDDG